MTTLDPHPPAPSMNDDVSPAAPAAGEEAPTRHRTLRAVGGAVVTVFLVALVALAVAVAVVPRVMGAVPLAVLSGSMEPALSPGDLVVSRPVAPEDVVIGDVITFQRESDNPALVTHRVVGVTLGTGGVSGFVTRGDANEVNDDPIVADQVMGRVVYSIPLVGYVTNAGWGPQVMGVAAVGLIVYGLVVVILPDRKDRKDPKNREEVQHA